MMSARAWIALPALALLIACGGAAKDAPPPAPPAGTVVLTDAQRASVRVGIVKTTAEMVTLPFSVPGTVGTPDPLTATIGSIVEGRVTSVRVLPGDQVTAGQLLVEIHSHELSSAQRDLAKADAEAVAAKLAVDRSERLLTLEAVAREEVERRRATYETAAAEQHRAREMVDHLNATRNDDVGVIAPRAGMVLAVHTKVGTAVTVGAPLVDIGDTRELWITGFVPENSALAVARGTRVGVLLAVLPSDTLTGRVVQMAGIVDSMRRAVELRVSLDTPPAGLRPGMFATLLLPRGQAVSRVVLPAAAVQRTASGEVVFVEESAGRYHSRPVKSIALGDGRVAVEGIAAGVSVVVQGAYEVRSALENTGPVE